MSPTQEPKGKGRSCGWNLWLYIRTESYTCFRQCRILDSELGSQLRNKKGKQTNKTNTSYFQDWVLKDTSLFFFFLFHHLLFHSWPEESSCSRHRRDHYCGLFSQPPWGHHGAQALWKLQTSRPVSFLLTIPVHWVTLHCPSHAAVMGVTEDHSFTTNNGDGGGGCTRGILDPHLLWVIIYWHKQYPKSGPAT